MNRLRLLRALMWSFIEWLRMHDPMHGPIQQICVPNKYTFSLTDFAHYHYTRYAA